MTIEIEVRAVRAGLINDGYIVFRAAVPVVLCEAVLEAIGTELGIWIGDPHSWDRVPSEIEEVPLRGHESQWDIRQLPDLYAIWSTVWGTERLWVDRNACRFTPPWSDGRAEPLPLHWDVDPHDRDVLWYQGSGPGAQKGPAGPFARRLHSLDCCSEYQPASPRCRPFFASALGLDVCFPLTTEVHRVRFPAWAPPPEGRAAGGRSPSRRRPDTQGYRSARRRSLRSGSPQALSAAGRISRYREVSDRRLRAGHTRLAGPPWRLRRIEE